MAFLTSALVLLTFYHDIIVYLSLVKLVKLFYMQVNNC